MPTTFDIDLIRSFTVITEAGSLTRAADRLGRTQAAVSMQVKRLEEAVNQSLFIRTGRGVTLTTHGERLLVHARRMLRSHDEAVADLLGKSLSGTLRFGCPDDYAISILPPLLRSFSSAYPNAMIEVFCAPTPRLMERLKNQTIDMALASLPEDAPADRILRRESLVWVGAKGGDAHERDPLQLALSDHDTLDHRAAQNGLDSVGRKYRIAYASSSFSGLLAMVRSGGAIAVVTEMSVPTDLQILSPSMGLPQLPGVGITLVADRKRETLLSSTFEAHARSVLLSL